MRVEVTSKTGGRRALNRATLIAIRIRIAISAEWIASVRTIGT